MALYATLRHKQKQEEDMSRQKRNHLPWAITATEAAKLIGVSKSTWYRWKKNSDQFPFAPTMYGRTLYYSRPEVEEYVKKINTSNNFYNGETQ
jgi:predicted DNA-binding transcriptional regulator AlpA